MSAPFRDELATAHATIERLEAEIRDLRAKRDQPRPKVPWANPLLGLAVLALGIGLVVYDLIGGAIAHRLHATDPTFRGIAVAPHDSIPPTVDNGNASRPAKASALDTADPYANPKAPAKCNCTPGDPLCSCL